MSQECLGSLRTCLDLTGGEGADANLILSKFPRSYEHVTAESHALRRYVTWPVLLLSLSAVMVPIM